MAFVKVKVDALEQQKKEYEKAIKSLDGALEQIKKVNASLGTDDTPMSSSSSAECVSRRVMASTLLWSTREALRRLAGE